MIQISNMSPEQAKEMLLRRIEEECRGEAGAIVQKITGSKTVDRPLQRIREFRNRPAPAVAVTVDMLSTGVDIPDLEFIIFLRPVKSRILFEQMLGRGTRKGDKFPDKSHFTVFDCFDGTLIQYFRQATGITAEPLQQETRTIQELVENIWQNRDRDLQRPVPGKADAADRQGNVGRGAGFICRLCCRWGPRRICARLAR